MTDLEMRSGRKKGMMFASVNINWKVKLFERKPQIQHTNVGSAKEL